MIKIKPDSKQEITLITNQAYAVRFDISEIPTSGSKAVGVKSANLKDNDYIVNYVLPILNMLAWFILGLLLNVGHLAAKT